MAVSNGLEVDALEVDDHPFTHSHLRSEKDEAGNVGSGHDGSVCCGLTQVSYSAIYTELAELLSILKRGFYK